MNDSGTVVGYFSTSGSVHGYIWTENIYHRSEYCAGVTNGVTSYAYAINSSGQVVGNYGVGAGASLQWWTSIDLGKLDVNAIALLSIRHQ